MAKSAIKSILAPAIAATLIAGAMVQGAFQPSPSDAAGYHQAIVEASNQVPLTAGPWTGKDVEIPDGALQLLRPNVARSRVYTREGDQAVAQFLLVQCKDARDLAGHYPPNCYPRVYNYRLIKDTPSQWTIDDMTIHGRTYVFKADDQPQSQSVVVQQFFAMPDGTTTDDVDAIYSLAGDFTQRHRGAAQFQVVYPADDPHTDQERDAIFELLVGSYSNVIRLILTDDTSGS